MQSDASAADFFGSFTAFKGIAAPGRFALTQKIFAAEPAVINGGGAGGGPIALYNFYADTPTSVTATLPDIYGSYIAKQNSANITRAWGYYQADAGDTNFYAGPTQFANTIELKNYIVSTLPTPTIGMLAYVTDGDAGLAWGATAVNTGGGATKYLVWYNGSNWTVMGK